VLLVIATLVGGSAIQAFIPQYIYNRVKEN
jgi:hypothetical protein